MINDDNHRDNPEKRIGYSTSAVPSMAPAPDSEACANVRFLYPRDFRVRAAVAYIESNYANVVSVLDLMRHTNLSRSRLGILFKSEVGVPPVRYLNETRIRQAAKLFQNSPVLRVKEVMAAVGINDLTYFGRQFKRMFSMTPTEYRAMCGAQKFNDERAEQDGDFIRMTGVYAEPYL